jgi:hypothetical protein
MSGHSKKQRMDGGRNLRRTAETHSTGGVNLPNGFKYFSKKDCEASRLLSNRAVEQTSRD